MMLLFCCRRLGVGVVVVSARVVSDGLYELGFGRAPKVIGKWCISWWFLHGL